MGAAFNELMENESKESLAEMVCGYIDKVHELKARIVGISKGIEEAVHTAAKLEAQIANANSILLDSTMPIMFQLLNVKTALRGKGL